MGKQNIHLTCIVCPIGCSLGVTKRGKKYEVEGNQCKKGIEYAITELTNPTRTLTSTVKTIFEDLPRLPVKTDKEILLYDIFLFMAEINDVVIDKQLKPGDTIIQNMLNTDVNLVATYDMTSDLQSAFNISKI